MRARHRNNCLTHVKMSHWLQSAYKIMWACSPPTLKHVLC